MNAYMREIRYVQVTGVVEVRIRRNGFSLKAAIGVAGLDGGEKDSGELSSTQGEERCWEKP